MGFRLVEEAETDLLKIWVNLALEIGNEPAADRLTGTLKERFFLLSDYPYLGRSREDLRPGLRSYPVQDYVILYQVEDEDVVILHIFPGRMDIPNLL